MVLHDKRCPRCNIYRPRNQFVRPDRRNMCKLIFHRYCNLCFTKKSNLYYRIPPRYIKRKRYRNSSC